MIEAKKNKQTKLDYFHRAKLLQVMAYNQLLKRNPNPNKKLLTYVTINNDKKIGLTPLALSVFAKKNWPENYSKSTWRYYRSAIFFYAEILKEKQLITEEVLTEIKGNLSGVTGSSKSKSKTSAQKMKHAKTADLIIISNEIKKSKSQYAKTLNLWLYTNIILGLRPCEWKETQIKGQCIIVKNAKHTNGRSHGNIRKISLSHLSEKDIGAIKTFSDHTKKIHENGSFDSTYEGCRKLLQRISRKCWPNRKKHISLYSTRHQFTADLKASGVPLEKIAYLMGHIATDTSTIHYGKKRNGKNKKTPEVTNDLTGAIKANFTKFTFGNKAVKKDM